MTAWTHSNKVSLETLEDMFTSAKAKIGIYEYEYEK